MKGEFEQSEWSWKIIEWNRRAVMEVERGNQQRHGLVTEVDEGMWKE